MKKTTTKKTAPAAKSTVTPKKPAPALAKTAPKKVATPAPKPAVAAKPPAAPKSAPAKKAPAVKPSTPLPVKVTTLSALVDVGFGNTLYLRGEGPGLSWDKGVKLECVSDDCWSIKLGASSKPIIFKFLLNDVAWSDGNDYIVTPGSSVELKPTFVAG